MQDKHPKRKLLVRDLTTNTIFKQVQAEVLERYAVDLPEEKIREIASIPYQRLHDLIHKEHLTEGEGVNILNIGKFYIKEGRLHIAKRLAELKEQGYSPDEAQVKLLDEWDNIKRDRANGNYHSREGI